MRRFFVADLNAQGEVLATAEYRYEHLEQLPGASDLIIHFSTNLYRTPQEFETMLPHGRDMGFRWRASAETAGISTLRDGEELVSLGLLASGINADADHLTLAAFQTHLLRELHGGPHEPAFEVLELQQRPLVAVVPFASPKEPTEQLVAALADRCFAAAYFRYLNLA